MTQSCGTHRTRMCCPQWWNRAQKKVDAQTTTLSIQLLNEKLFRNCVISEKHVSVSGVMLVLVISIHFRLTIRLINDKLFTQPIGSVVECWRAFRISRALCATYHVSSSTSCPTIRTVCVYTISGFNNRFHFHYLTYDNIRIFSDSLQWKHIHRFLFLRRFYFFIGVRGD